MKNLIYLRAVILPDDISVDEVEEIEKLDGKLGSDPSEDKLMKTVMENDSDEIPEGKFVNEMINQGTSTFQPDLAFSQLVQNYKNAENIYGKTLLREATGYSADTIKRNINIPEFQRELQAKLSAKKRELEDAGVLNKQGEILDHGIKMASLQLFISELDNLDAKGFDGEHEQKEFAQYGMRQDSRVYKKGDRFKDLDLKKSLKVAIKRGRKELSVSDLQTSQRESKGNVCIVYGLDASGSMRGKKISVAKKAGVALSYKASQNNDKVGVIVFSDEIETEVQPTTDFPQLLDAFTTISASQQTDIANTITQAISLFPKEKMTKHLIFITDAQTTVGNDPNKHAFEAAAQAASQGISISIIGIDLEKDAKEFAVELTTIGGGKLYVVDNLDDLDHIVLHDYESVR